MVVAEEEQLAQVFLQANTPRIIQEVTEVAVPAVETVVEAEATPAAA